MAALSEKGNYPNPLGSHSVVPPFGLRGSDQVRVGSLPVVSTTCLLVDDLIFRGVAAQQYILLDDLGSNFQRESVVTVGSGFPFRVTYLFRSLVTTRCYHL